MTRTSDSPRRRAEILLVEDNHGDVMLMERALKKGRVAANLTVARDGEEALRLLREGRVAPDLVLLDLNLPGMSGIEVLSELKGDVALRRIPVVVLTSSKNDEDVRSVYDLHGNAYLTKPAADPQTYYQLVVTLEHWWFVFGRLPPK